MSVAPTLESLREQRNEILALAEQYGATNVRVFGSVARGEARPDSDIDFFGAVPRQLQIAPTRWTAHGP